MMFFFLFIYCMVYFFQSDHGGRKAVIFIFRIRKNMGKALGEMVVVGGRKLRRGECEGFVVVPRDPWALDLGS